MKNSSENMSIRYAGLDIARSILTAFVVLYHTSLIFETASSWRIAYPDKDPFYDHLSDFLISFIMHGFYILAGYFFCLSYEKHGLKKTIVSRIIRLGVPLIVIGATLNTVMNIMSEERSYSGDILTYIFQGQWLGHLWFIGNLIVYCLSSCLFVKFLLKARNPVKNPYVQAGILYSGIPFLCLCFLFVAKSTYSGDFLFISFYSLFLYFSSYLLGMLLYRLKDAYLVMTDIKVAGVMCLTACAITYAPGFPEAGIAFHYFMILRGITISLFLIAICCVFSLQTKTIRSLSEASYSIYLLHQPFLVILFPVILLLGYGHAFSSLILFSVVFFGCWLIDRYIIAKSPILGFLFSGSIDKKRQRSLT